MVLEAGELADGVHEPGPGREGPGAKVRAPPLAHGPPVLDALGLMEPPRCDPVAHALPIPVDVERPDAIRQFTGPGRIAELPSSHDSCRTERCPERIFDQPRGGAGQQSSKR